MPATPLNDSSTGFSRRDFLVLLTKISLALSGFLGLGGILRFLGAPSQEAPPTQFDLGPADRFPPGVRRTLPQARAVLVHSSQGFAAFSTECPHLGCVVDGEGTGFTCPCHGSQFDATGGLTRGPANNDLRKLRLEVDEQGRLILYTT